MKTNNEGSLIESLAHVTRSPADLAAEATSLAEPSISKQFHPQMRAEIDSITHRIFRALSTFPLSRGDDSVLNRMYASGDPCEGFERMFHIAVADKSCIFKEVMKLLGFENMKNEELLRGIRPYLSEHDVKIIESDLGEEFNLRKIKEAINVVVQVGNLFKWDFSNVHLIELFAGSSKSKVRTYVQGPPYCARFMGKLIEGVDTDAAFYALDTDIEPEVEEKITHKVHWIKGDTDDIASMLQSGTFDLVLINGYTIRSGTEEVSKILKPGGIAIWINCDSYEPAPSYKWDKLRHGLLPIEGHGYDLGRDGIMCVNSGAKNITDSDSPGDVGT